MLNGAKTKLRTAQARIVIASTSRIYDEKTYDLTIDYYGVSEYLKQTLTISNPKDI